MSMNNDVYNEINANQRHSAERKADPRVFFYQNGNPFLGFMHFLERMPVPKKVVDEQRLMSDFSEYAAHKRKINRLIIICVISFIFSCFIPFIFIISIIILIAIAILNSVHKNNGYYTIDDYKAYVIERAISSQVEELVYEPKFGLPQSVFKDINVIRNGNRYHTEDLVTGKFHGVYFVQSDLTVEYHSDKKTITYFMGQWVTIQYPKKFMGTVTIIDDRFVYGVKRKELEKMELENPDFNKMFNVRASDMHLAYYLLTPQIMERLMYIRQNANGHVIVCFKDGMVHIGISNNKNSFEPNVNNVNLYADIQKFQYEFSLVSGLIEILKIDNNVYAESNNAQLNQAYQQNVQLPYSQQFPLPIQKNPWQG